MLTPEDEGEEAACSAGDAEAGRSVRQDVIGLAALYRCAACGRRQTDRSASAFCGYRFPDEVIALAVRRHLRFRLPYADIAELLAERGVHIDPSSVYDWVQ